MSSPCVISFFFIFFSSVKRIIEFFVYWTFWLWFRMYLRKGTSVLRLSDWWSHRDARDLFKWKEEWILFLLMLIGQYTFMNHKRTKCPRLYKYLAKVSIDGTLRMLWGQGELRSWEERPANAIWAAPSHCLLSQARNLKRIPKPYEPPEKISMSEINIKDSC